MYAYYHYSGTAALVDKAHAAKARYNEVRTAFKANRPRTAAEAVAFLRSFSRSRSGTPGPIPDAFVDMVAQFQGDYEEDIDRIVFGACDDIQTIVSESRAASPDADGGMGEEGLTADDRKRISAVVQKRVGELQVHLRGRSKEGDAEDTPVVKRWRTKYKEAQQRPEDDDKP